MPTPTTARCRPAQHDGARAAGQLARRSRCGRRCRPWRTGRRRGARARGAPRRLAAAAAAFASSDSRARVTTIWGNTTPCGRGSSGSVDRSVVVMARARLVVITRLRVARTADRRRSFPTTPVGNDLVRGLRTAQPEPVICSGRTSRSNSSAVTWPSATAAALQGGAVVVRLLGDLGRLVVADVRGRAR